MISVVGPAGSSGFPSMASNAPELPSGLIAVPSMEGDAPTEVASHPLSPPTKDQVLTQSGITLEAGLLTRSAGSRQADDRSLDDVNRIDEFVAHALAWFEATPTRIEDPAVEPASSSPELTWAIEPVVTEDLRLDRASVISPVGIGLILGMLAYRYRRLFRSRNPSRQAQRTIDRSEPILSGPRGRLRVNLG